MRPLLIASLLASIPASGGCGGKGPAVTMAAPHACDDGRGAVTAVGDFARTTIDAAASGAAFVTAADLDGDGRLDLVVSRFGDYVVDGAAVRLSPARLDVYYQGAGAGCWHQAPLLGADAGLYFINQVSAADVDGDGDLDLIVPAGFFVCGFDPSLQSCGALLWLENQGGRFRRHDLLGPRSTRFYHHAEWVDLDGDGARDLVVVGEATAGPQTLWLAGDRSPDRFRTTPLVLGDGLGSFPQVVDVDGDGDLDVAAAEYFVDGSSFAWLEQIAPPAADAPAGRYRRHVIDGQSGKGFQLALIPDLYGDQVTRAVATNHSNANGSGANAVDSAVLVLDRPADASGPWPRHAISDGIRSRPSAGAAVLGAPGVFGWGDIDGDGDLDLAVAGDGDARTFWLEQTAPGQFTTHVLEPQLGQASGARVVDLDGDGRNELVFTGYEDGVVYVYRWKGGAR